MSDESTGSISSSRTRWNATSAMVSTVSCIPLSFFRRFSPPGAPRLGVRVAPVEHVERQLEHVTAAKQGKQGHSSRISMHAAGQTRPLRSGYGALVGGQGREDFQHLGGGDGVLHRVAVLEE